MLSRSEVCICRTLAARRLGILHFGGDRGDRGVDAESARPHKGRTINYLLISMDSMNVSGYRKQPVRGSIASHLPRSIYQLTWSRDGYLRVRAAGLWSWGWHKGRSVGRWAYDKRIQPFSSIPSRLNSLSYCVVIEAGVLA